MSVLEWLGYTAFTITAAVIFVRLIFVVGELLGWNLIEDIPEGHPDQFGGLDRAERGLR